MHASSLTQLKECWDLDRLATKDADGKAVVGMSGSSCAFNWAAGASVGAGLIVEFGTWTGGSSRCFGGGLSTTGRAKRMLGFDMFAVGFSHGNTAMFKTMLSNTSFEKLSSAGHSLDIEPIYRWNMHDVYPTAIARRGNFRKTADVRTDIEKLAGIRAADAARDATSRIDVFSTDAAKHKVNLQEDLRTAAPFLAAGSLLHLADHLQYPFVGENAASNQVLWMHAALVPEIAELVGFTEEGSAFYALKVSRDPAEPPPPICPTPLPHLSIPHLSDCLPPLLRPICLAPKTPLNVSVLSGPAAGWPLDRPKCRKVRSSMMARVEKLCTRAVDKMVAVCQSTLASLSGRLTGRGGPLTC